jgi:hypothetical protein
MEQMIDLRTITATMIQRGFFTRIPPLTTDDRWSVFFITAAVAVYVGIHDDDGGGDGRWKQGRWK